MRTHCSKALLLAILTLRSIPATSLLVPPAQAAAVQKARTAAQKKTKRFRPRHSNKKIKLKGHRVPHKGKPA